MVCCFSIGCLAGLQYEEGEEGEGRGERFKRMKQSYDQGTQSHLKLEKGQPPPKNGGLQELAQLIANCL